MENSESDVLAYMDFPQNHWSKIYSTNPLERLNREAKRRSAVGIFPCDISIIRLIGAVLSVYTQGVPGTVDRLRQGAGREAGAKITAGCQPQGRGDQFYTTLTDAILADLHPNLLWYLAPRLLHNYPRGEELDDVVTTALETPGELESLLATHGAPGEAWALDLLHGLGPAQLCGPQARAYVVTLLHCYQALNGYFNGEPMDWGCLSQLACG